MHRKRPKSKVVIASAIARRSISGASTASQESAAQDSKFEPHTAYTPLLHQSQSLPQQPHSNNGLLPNDFYPVAEHAALEHIHEYNHSQNSRVSVRLHGLNDQLPMVAHNEGYLNGFHAANNVQSNIGFQLAGREASNSVPPGGPAGTDAEKMEKKGGNSNAANEKELRELLEKSEGRTLDSIVRDVRNAERSQKSEKAKQLFAMRWLREFCVQDKESVPRSRVYTHYAQRCGTDRIDILNAASFGKLVRIIFPGIATRRLGGRGESKYHYVNLTLCEDPEAVLARPQSAQNSLAYGERAVSFEPEPYFNPVLRAPADTAAFPPQDQLFDRPPLPVLGNNPQSHGRLFAECYGIGLSINGEEPHMYRQTLRFSLPDETYLQDESMVLPDIYQFLPARTDTDLADALTALYRTHCTSLVDALRYVKEKQFIRLLGTFSGTLTVPVSRLFAHPKLAPWIKMCDWLMYQQIVRFISHLALQVIPAPVFTMLGNVSNTLTQNITKNFQHYPDHILQAKLEPATLFASLMYRLLRVNETAHAASHLLSNDQMRNLMWQDWVKSVRAKRVVESELPGCGYEEVYRIITTEIRQLLEPLEPSDWYEAGTEYQIDPFSDSRKTQQAHSLDTSSENVINRWADFLRTLPRRFPQASTRTLLHCISVIGTATLRDVTVNQAQSFGCWWITKVWIDEMMLWLAEIGGFLGSTSSVSSDSPPNFETFDKFLETTRRSSRNSIEPNQPAGLGIHFPHSPNYGLVQAESRVRTGPPTATFTFAPRLNGQPKPTPFDFQDDSHDDSGIGASLLSADLNHGKHAFISAHEASGADTLIS